jgi:hypothetical protein
MVSQEQMRILESNFTTIGTMRQVENSLEKTLLDLLIVEEITF